MKDLLKIIGDFLKALVSKLNPLMAGVVLIVFIVVAGGVTAYYFYTKVEIERTIRASTDNPGKVAYGIETNIPKIMAGTTKTGE